MRRFLILLVPFLFLLSCKSLPEENLSEILPEETEIFIPEPDPELQYIPENLPPVSNELTLIFGGDIMAHTQNYSMSDYNKIWAGIKDITRDSDFTFGNIEAPIADNMALSSYPAFNLHSNYVEAAIDAGFNVFSLSNNHTNDKYLDGIKASMEFSKATEEKYATSERKVYFSGLKDGEKAEFSYQIIEKNGWKILFVAITQLLNRPDYSTYINYVPSKTETKKAFISWCKKLREENPCDLFILSLHTNEDEYIRTVTKKQRDWYRQILDNAQVDILWANHAHIIKHQEKFKTDSKIRYPTKLLMCANGNTISGQRTSPNLKSSFTERDDTGDGLLYKITLKKMPDSGKPFIYESKRFFITTYINTANEYILKKLDDSFIDYLVENRPSWVEYIKKRINICESIEDKTH